jgi:formate dehydrogenase subunit gamma
MTVERYPRSARRYHTAIYLVTLLLLATGWWLLTGREGQPSPIARLLGVPDVQLHVWLGWALLIMALLPLPFAIRGVKTFVRETVRRDKGDLRWLIRLPAAIVTGRFPRHDGHFDPGQRIANVVMTLTLTALLVTGVGALYLPRSLAVAAFDLHRWAAFLITPVLLGHIIVAAGILPGYQGAWRSMHLGGQLPTDVARRIWPAWLERERR